MKESKDIKLAKALGLADEEYVAEAEPKRKISKAATVIAKKTLIAAACVACAALLAVAAFRMGPRFPYGEHLATEEESTTEAVEILDIADKYADSPYYETIMALENWNPDNAISSGGFILDSAGSSGESSKYIEVTDNQVDGVIESDIFKRTESHVFTVTVQKNASVGFDLYIYAYSIDKENSRRVAQYKVDIPLEGGGYSFELTNFSTPQMLLSDDGRTLTVLVYLYGKPTANMNDYMKSISETAVISFDVSDPSNITQRGYVKVSGSLNTARRINGSIILFTGRSVWRTDYDRPESFLPFVDIDGEFEFLPQEDILIPDELTERMYAAVTVIDEDTLEINGMKAYYGYTGIPYVTENMIFLPYSYMRVTEKDGESEHKAMTDILVLIYGSNYLMKYSKFTVTGAVKDQYSLDCHEGILRVVTSTGVEAGNSLSVDVVGPKNMVTNANLYCISLEEYKVVGKVIGFAPEGETVQSVRFDGDMAYVCTAEVATLTDPVYFFDLSDPSNITYTDTGVIEGYSTSLIELEGGYLLGIGYGEGGMTLKIEVYSEENGKVVPFSTYTREKCSFSESYKSYLIDRESGYFGLCIHDYNTGGRPEYRYLLVAFDGTQLVEVQDIQTDDNVSASLTRAFIDDGYIYIVSKAFFQANSINK